MPTLSASPIPGSLTVQMEGILDLDDDRLFEFCRRNRDLRVERTSAGELLLMSPAGGKTSNLNLKIASQLAVWAERDGSGEAFDSSGGFILPNGAMRSPDAAWVEHARLRRLTREQRERFLPLCPTFIVELRSPSDGLATVQRKMGEYIDNGTRLGWLIDPIENQIHVYRPGVEAEVLQQPTALAADPELPHFVLDLDRIWDPSW